MQTRLHSGGRQAACDLLLRPSPACHPQDVLKQWHRWAYLCEQAPCHVNKRSPLFFPFCSPSLPLPGSLLSLLQALLPPTMVHRLQKPTMLTSTLFHASGFIIHWVFCHSAKHTAQLDPCCQMALPTWSLPLSFSADHASSRSPLAAQIACHFS